MVHKKFTAKDAKRAKEKDKQSKAECVILSSAHVIEYSMYRSLRQTAHMKLSDDLPHAGWMWLKAILFFVIGAMCIAALCIEYSNARDIALLLLAI